jgi:hypothetical protein
MATTADNIAKVRARISAAAEKVDRDQQSILLLAVSKTRPAEMIRLAAAAGISDIGENYLQEALDKQAELQDLDVTWHFIGPIQSNKTRPIAEHFDWVHSVDRLKIARRLSEQRPSHLPPLNICLQVNISAEASKSGVSLDELPALAASVNALPNIQLRGLMAIPQACDNIDQQRQAFAQLRQALVNLQTDLPELDTLSMGMSGDLEAAIAEGATIVRIGTDIFGSRP